MKFNLLDELIWVDLRGFGLGCWLDQFKHYSGTSERQTDCFKIVKLEWEVNIEQGVEIKESGWGEGGPGGYIDKHDE